MRQLNPVRDASEERCGGVLLMQPLILLILVGALFVGFSNGANDNFKGFATVWGSHSLSYRRALAFATVATIAGGIASVMLAHGLVQQFSGKGLVPDGIVASHAFVGAVAIGAAVTVIAATRIGMPVSTSRTVPPAAMRWYCEWGRALNGWPPVSS